MSDAATRILEQLQAQNDLRMQAANDIAQAVAARVNAENALTEAKANEKAGLCQRPQEGLDAAGAQQDSARHAHRASAPKRGRQRRIRAARFKQLASFNRNGGA